MSGRRFVTACLSIILINENLVLSAPALHNGRSPIVDTNKGKVQGLRLAHKGQVYDVFRGIPFAKPPVATRRFQRPQESEKWDGIKQTTNFSIACTQIARDISGEDCLYLNVYVPKGVGNVKSLPVMAYAHGGGFTIGSADTYVAEELALTGQVIVITYNYRLSALGGLATRSAAAPGNYQLWDARAALIWIRDNVANFGGDNTRVTAFGQSAGSALTSHLAISPMTKGLLQRAIALSGTAASSFGHQYDSRQNAKNLALYEDCPQNDMRSLVACLKQRNPHDVDVSGLVSLVVEGGVLPGWLPAVDGVFVPDFPKKMWEKGAGSHVDYMVGRTEHDCAGFVYLNIRGAPRPQNETINLAEDKDLLNFILEFLLQSYAKDDDVQTLVDAVKLKYPDIDSDDVTKRTKAVEQCATDWLFASSAHYEAKLHSKNSKATGKKTYLYNFKYRPSFTHYAPWVTGSHSDDLHFVFGEPYRREFRKNTLGEWSAEDIKLKNNMMAYLANFAYTGDPNKGPHKVSTSWPEYSNTSKEYMELSSKMAVRKEDKKLLSRYDFWLNVFPSLSRPEKA